MGVSINLHTQPHLPSPCIRTVKMRGCSKIAWMDAIGTTRYPLILMLCCDIKHGVPSDEDL